jgi:hypothetical protein
MVILLKDITTGETYSLYLYYLCDAYKYPDGKPVPNTDEYAGKEEEIIFC